MNLANINIQDILINIIALIVAIVPHEVAHGYAAYFCGDNTAKIDGRLSLNPLHHVDPIGLLCMVFMRFGWAKAVPINPSKFTKNRKMSSLLVAIAGVSVNFVLGILFGILLVLFVYRQWPLRQLIESIFWYNIMLGVFNLVPLPPLDGSKVIATLLPTKWEYTFYQYEKYFYIVLVIALLSGIVTKVIGPIVYFIMNGIIAIGVHLWTTIL